MITISCFLFSYLDVTSGILLLITAFLFYVNYLELWSQCVLWFFVFVIASPGASSAHLTISELFPVAIRSQAMAIFFSIGLGVGGVCAPFIFGILIQQHDRFSVLIGYSIGAFLMITAGIVELFIGVDAENMPLEELNSEFKFHQDHVY